MPQARPETAPLPARPDNASRGEGETVPARPSEARRPSITDEASSTGTKPESSALKSLLDRASAVTVQDTAAGSTADTALLTPSRPHTAAAPEADEAAASPAASPSPLRSETGGAEVAATSPAQPEPNIDRMLREIFEGRNGHPANADAPQPTAAEPSKTAADEQSDEENEAETKRSLADRLRVV
jgi:hypothetical protein